MIPPMIFKRELNLVIVDFPIDPLFSGINVFVEDPPPTGSNTFIPLKGVSQLFTDVIRGGCHTG